MNPADALKHPLSMSLRLSKRIRVDGDDPIPGEQCVAAKVTESREEKSDRVPQF
jgi:hypothetical protein